MARNIIELLAEIGALDQKPGTVSDASATAAYRQQHQPTIAMPVSQALPGVTPVGSYRGPQASFATPDSGGDGGSVAGDIWGFIKKGIDVIDTPRAFVVSGVKELSSALYNTGWSKTAVADAVGLGETDQEYNANRERQGEASWNDFVDQGWRNIGFREVWDDTHDSEGDKSWMNRIIGVAGDVALDPLTHAGAKMVPGRKGVETVASRELAAAVKGGGRNEIAKQLERAATRAGIDTLAEGPVRKLIAEATERGTGALTKKAIERVGLSADEVAALGIGEMRTTIMKMAVPGSRALSDAGAGLRGAAKKAFGELPWAKAYRSTKLGAHAGEVHWVNEMRAKGVTAAHRVQATKALATVNKTREVARRWADGIAKTYRRDFGRELHHLSAADRVATTHALEAGVQEVLPIKLRQFFDKTRKSLVAKGVDVGHLENYVPHMVTDEFRALAQKDKSLLQWITDLKTKQGFQKTRTLEAGDAFMGEVLEKGTIAEINGISMSKVGVRLFEDDIVEIMPRYLLKGERALEASAQRKALEEIGLIVNTPPSGRAARKLASEDAASLKAHKKALAVARRDEAIALSDGMKVRRSGIQAARDAIIEQKKAVGERITELDMTVNQAGRDRVEAVSLVDDLQGQLTTAEAKMSALQEQAAKVPASVKEQAVKPQVVVDVQDGIPVVKSGPVVPGVRRNAVAAEAEVKAMRRIQQEIDDTAKLIELTNSQLRKAKTKLARIEREAAKKADPAEIERIAQERAALRAQMDELRPQKTALHGKAVDPADEAYRKVQLKALNKEFDDLAKAEKKGKFANLDEEMVYKAQKLRLLRINEESMIAFKNGDTAKLEALAAERKAALRIIEKPDKALLTRDEILRLTDERDRLIQEQARMSDDLLRLQEFGMSPPAGTLLSPPGAPHSPPEAPVGAAAPAKAPKGQKAAKKARKPAEEVVDDLWDGQGDITFDDIWGGEDVADDMAGWEPAADYFGDPRFAPAGAKVAPLTPTEHAAEVVSQETARVAELKTLPQTADAAAKVATETYSFVAADKDTVLGLLNDTERDLDDMFDQILNMPEGKGLDARRANAYELRAQVDHVRQLLEQSTDPSMDVIGKLEAQAAVFDMKALKAGKEGFEAEDFIKALGDPKFQKYVARKTEYGFTKLDETHQIPSWIDDALQVENRMRDLNKAVKFFDKFNNLWKGWATMTPGFLNRNIYGGLMNIYLEGGTRALGNAYRFVKFWKMYRKNPETYMNEAVLTFGRDTAERMDSAMGIVFGTGGGQVPAEVLLAPGGKKTLLDRAGIGQGLSVNPFKTDFAPIRGTRAASTNIEAILRGGHAFDVMSRGGTADLAQDVVTKWHFNYMDISDLDKRIKRYGIPFWTFYSRNLALQAHVWSHMPQKLNRTYFNAKRNIEYGNERDDTRPQWFDESGAIQFGDKGDTTDFLIPDLPSIRAVGDVSKLADPTDMRWVGDFNPLLKLPIEQFADKQSFSGIPFKDSYAETVDGQTVGREAPMWAQIPGIQQVLQGLGQVETNASGQTVMTDRSQYMLESLMPLLGTQNRVLPTQPRQEDRQLQNLLSFLGVGYRENNDSTRQGEQYRRNLEAEKVAKLRKELGL